MNDDARSSFHPPKSQAAGLPAVVSSLQHVFGKAGVVRGTKALLGLKAAYDKAQAANGGKRPNQDQVIAAFENLTFEGPGGPVAMSLGKGHQAVQGTAYGTVKHEGGKVTVTNVKRYPASRITPPDGVKSEEWIKSGFKTAK